MVKFLSISFQLYVRISTLGQHPQLTWPGTPHQIAWELKKYSGDVSEPPFPKIYGHFILLWCPLPDGFFVINLYFLLEYFQIILRIKS